MYSDGRRRTLAIVAASLALALLLAAASPAFAFRRTGSKDLTPIEALGKKLFFDPRLSEPRGQSCAECHAPSVGYTGPDSKINSAGAVYEGAVKGRFGNRKPPAAAYGGASPVFGMPDDVFTGGMFWDGRATGWTLGDPLAEQAMGPFLNPLEQNNPSAAAVVAKVEKSGYAGLFREVWGADAFADTDTAYEYIGHSIAAYERSSEVNPYASRYDEYLATGEGLTEQELEGLALFEGKAGCSACHPSRPVGDVPPDFTDFTYDNLGVPRNPENPFYEQLEYNPDGYDWIDPGLGGFLATTAGGMPDYSSFAEDAFGMHKVPTLRNVDKRPYAGFVKAFGHNGYFKSLEEIVHFYNTRDVPGAGWPEPEYAATMNTAELGDLGLTPAEEDSVVAFLKTLSDR